MHCLNCLPTVLWPAAIKKKDYSAGTKQVNPITQKSTRRSLANTRLKLDKWAERALLHVAKLKNRPTFVKVSLLQIPQAVGDGCIIKIKLFPSEIIETVWPKFAFYASFLCSNQICLLGATGSWWHKHILTKADFQLWIINSKGYVRFLENATRYIMKENLIWNFQSKISRNFTEWEFLRILTIRGTDEALRHFGGFPASV